MYVHSPPVECDGLEKPQPAATRWVLSPAFNMWAHKNTAMCLKVSTMSRYHTSDGPLGRLHPANSLSPIKAVCPSSHTSTAEPRGIRIITPNANQWPKLTLSMRCACDPTRLSRIAELHSYFANMLLGHRQTFQMLNNTIAFESLSCNLLYILRDSVDNRKPKFITIRVHRCLVP